MRHFGILFIMAAFVFLGTGFAPQEKVEKKDAPTGATAKTVDVYTCPMHPDVCSDKPGECPKCKMTLEKKAMKCEMAAAKKGASGCCSKCCGKMKGAKASTMKMDCPADSTKAKHSKMTMKGCCGE